MTERGAIIHANSMLDSSKEFGRFYLKDPKEFLHILSLAVEGGSRQLRSLDKIKDLNLSEHGDWRKIHLRTIEACLGKKPFFRYIFPPLCNVYLNKEINSLEEFNSAIFKILYSFIIGTIQPTELIIFFESEILQDRGREIAGDISPELSSMEAVASFGKEVLLGFLAANFK